MNKDLCTDQILSLKEGAFHSSTQSLRWLLILVAGVVPFLMEQSPQDDFPQKAI